MIALDNSNIFNRANEAVDTTSLQKVQNAANLIWADAYLKGQSIDLDDIREEL